ncbi:MAG: hypothetical protein OXI65_04360 [Acidobacteriota bacterium]|nr:hypothetical protein [Acidobacteriota bacterium]
MRLDQRFDAHHPLGELTDLLVHFCAPAADLSLHVKAAPRGGLPRGKALRELRDAVLEDAVMCEDREDRLEDEPELRNDH